MIHDSATLHRLSSHSSQLTKARFPVIVGIDGQYGIGPWTSADNELIFGDWAAGPRGAKGNMLVRLAENAQLCFQNTMNENPWDAWTCHYDGKARPKQIDYIMAPWYGHMQFAAMSWKAWQHPRTTDPS